MTGKRDNHGLLGKKITRRGALKGVGAAAGLALAPGFVRYTQAQSIVRSFKAGGGYDRLLTTIRSDRAAAAMLKMVRLWRRIPGLR